MGLVAPVHYAVLHKLPEKETGSARRAPPLAETHVLIGWYKNNAHLAWVLKAGLYNFRMDVERGSLRLRPEVSAAQYLLLHSHKGAQPAHACCESPRKARACFHERH